MRKGIKQMKKIKFEQDQAVLKISVNVKATIRDAKSGRVKRSKMFHNIIPTVGRAAIANNMTSVSPSPAGILPNYCAVGTGTNAPANGDTTLQTETARSVIASRTNSSNIAYITGFFGATDVSGTLREAAIVILGTASANTGTLLSRVAINITKALTETLTLDWTITIS